MLWVWVGSEVYSEKHLTKLKYPHIMIMFTCRVCCFKYHDSGKTALPVLMHALDCIVLNRITVDGCYKWYPVHCYIIIFYIGGEYFNFLSTEVILKYLVPNSTAWRLSLNGVPIMLCYKHTSYFPFPDRFWQPYILINMVFKPSHYTTIVIL